MNLVFPCFCVVIAGAAGYIMEPELENTLLNKKPSNQPEVVLVTEDGQPITGTPAPAPLPKQEPKPETKFDVPQTIPAPPPPSDPQPAAGDVATNNNPGGAPAPGHEDLLPPPPASSDDLAGGNSTDSAQSGGIVDLMKASIRDGQVTEFKYDQVLGWKETGTEMFDGESYKTGLAAFKEDSIFGIKTVQAKALIKDGKVVKWIRVKTGVEIK